MTTTLFGIQAPLYTVPSVAALAIDAAPPSRELASEFESIGSAYMDEGAFDRGGELLREAHAFHALISKRQPSFEEVKARQTNVSSIVAQTPRKIWAQVVSRANAYTPSPALDIETRKGRSTVCEIFGTYCLEKLAEMAVRDVEAVNALSSLVNSPLAGSDLPKRGGAILAHLSIEAYYENHRVLWTLMCAGNEEAKSRLQVLDGEGPDDFKERQVRDPPPEKSLTSKWAKVRRKAEEVEAFFRDLEAEARLPHPTQSRLKMERILGQIRLEEGSSDSRYQGLLNFKRELVKDARQVSGATENHKKELSFDVFKLPIPDVLKQAISDEERWQLVQARADAFKKKSFIIGVLASPDLFSFKELYQILEGYHLAITRGESKPFIALIDLFIHRRKSRARSIEKRKKYLAKIARFLDTHPDIPEAVRTKLEGKLAQLREVPEDLPHFRAVVDRLITRMNSFLARSKLPVLD